MYLQDPLTKTQGESSFSHDDEYADESPSMHVFHKKYANVDSLPS